MLAHVSGAEAAWVTIRNNTPQTIVVQETLIVNGQPKRGRPTTLLPGESFREFIPAPTNKKVEVIDPKRPPRLLWSGVLKCADETQTFAVTGAAGRVSVVPLKPPATKK
jgi:hypothetical protein